MKVRSEDEVEKQQYFSEQYLREGHLKKETKPTSSNGHPASSKEEQFPILEKLTPCDVRVLVQAEVKLTPCDVRVLVQAEVKLTPCTVRVLRSGRGRSNSKYPGS